MSTKIANILLALIVLLGISIRLYRLSDVPVSLYWDEAAIAYDAFSLNTTGLDMHGNTFWQPIYLSYGDYKAPVYIWLVAFAMKLTGYDDIAVRLPSAVAGVVGIIFTYTLVVEVMRKREIGLLAALALALLPGDILFSRSGFEAHLGMLFVLVTVYLWFVGKRKPGAFIVSGGVAAIGVYSYFSVRVVIPLLLVGFCLLYWKIVAKRWIVMISGALLFCLLLIPLYQSPFYTASNQLRLSTPSLLNTNDHIVAAQSMRDATGNTILGRFIYHRYWYLGLRFFHNLTSHIDWRYLFFTGDTNLRHGTGTVGIMLTGMLPFFVAGVIFLLRRDLLFALFVGFWWGVALIPASIPLVVPHALRSLNAIPIFGVVVGSGMYALLTSRVRLTRIIAVIFVFPLVIGLAVFIHDYFSHYPSASADSWQYTETALAQKLLKTSPLYTHIAIVNPPSRFYLYLLWQGRISPQAIHSWNGAEPIGFDRFYLSNTPDNTADLLVLPADQYDMNTYSALGYASAYNGTPAYYLIEPEKNNP